jgi:energy-coupling factor transporter ATP-binding protein EcfA2
MPKYVLDAKESANPPIEPFAVECGRISVLLGSNGSGKTRFIYRMMDRSLSSEKKNSFIYVEGSRTFRDKIINIDPHNETHKFNENPKQFEDTYIAHRRSELTHRVQLSLQLLKLRSRKEYEAYIKAGIAWDKGGRKGPSPTEPLQSLQRMFLMFNEIFPEISLQETDSGQLYCLQNGQMYTAPEASEGEKQVIGLLSDLLLNPEEGLVILVDEPEAHMNPLLACDVWSVIEAHMPEAQFVYATHSVLFALRPSVTSLFVMDKATYQPKQISQLKDIPAEELEQSIGSIPYVLSKRVALGVEGNDVSFDATFYRWVLGRNDIAIVPLGDRNKVLGETERLSLLREIAPNAKILGIVDADFKLTEADKAGKSPTVLVLGYHEAESYLCVPEIGGMMAERITGKPQSEAASEAAAKIVEFAKDRMIKIVGWRSFARLSFPIHASIPSATLSKLPTIEALTKCVQEQLAKQHKAAQESLAPESIAKAIYAEHKQLEAAIKAADIDALLRLLPGKELLPVLTKLSGSSSAENFLLGCIAHLDPSQFKATKALHDQILERLR